MGLNKKIALSVAASQALDASGKQSKKSWLQKATKKVKGAFNANRKNR